MTDKDKDQETIEPAGGKENRRGGATTADKIALGVGAAAAIGVATGLFIARQSAKAMRKYIIRDDDALKEYWLLDYSRDSEQQTRYFCGTEAAIQRRIKHIQGEVNKLERLEQAQAEELVKAGDTHIIEL
ncbi:MAG: hypothetical protein ABRQ24_06935 [Syntrophomonadaceae bacterium]